MSFIDDDLLWCPDNDVKLIDLASLVSDGGGGGGNNAMGGNAGTGQNGQGTSLNLPGLNSSNSHSLNSFSMSLSHGDHDGRVTSSDQHIGHNGHHLQNPYNQLQMSSNCQRTGLTNTGGNGGGPHHPSTMSSSSSYSGTNGNSHGSCRVSSSSGTPTPNCSNNNRPSADGSSENIMSNGQHGQNQHHNPCDLPTLSQLSQADLSGLVSSVEEDDCCEDLLKQFGENSFELDAIFDVFVDENNPNHPQQQFSSFVHNQHQSNLNPALLQQGKVAQAMANGQIQSVHAHHLLNAHLNMNGNNSSMGNHHGAGNQYHSDETTNGKKKKKLMSCDISMNEHNGHGQNVMNGIHNNDLRKQSVGSILQNQLCQPHQLGESPLSSRINKATIASANPLLAEKLAAPMTPGMSNGDGGNRQLGNGMHDNGMDNLITNIKTECGEPGSALKGNVRKEGWRKEIARLLVK